MSFFNTGFSYNGVESSDLNIELVSVGKDTLTQSFSSPKTFIKEHVRFKITYHYGSDKNTYTLSIQIMKTNGDTEEFTLEERMEIMRFFCPDDEFHAFISQDFPDIEFWVQFNKAQFIGFREGIGYFEFEAESNHPYPFSSMEYSEYDLSDNATSTIIEISNNCNTSPYFTPNFMEFSLVGNSTDFKLKNLSNGGKELTFTNLDLLETVAINSNQEIISSTSKERISKFNFGFNALELCYGINRLQITGKCMLGFKMQCPIQI